MCGGNWTMVDCGGESMCTGKELAPMSGGSSLQGSSRPRNGRGALHCHEGNDGGLGWGCDGVGGPSNGGQAAGALRAIELTTQAKLR